MVQKCCHWLENLKFDVFGALFEEQRGSTCLCVYKHLQGHRVTSIDKAAFIEQVTAADLDFSCATGIQRATRIKINILQFFHWELIPNGVSL